MSTNAALAVWGGGGLLALLFLWLVIRGGRRLRLLLDTPTSRAKGVFVGQVEIAGRAVLARPVRTFLAGAEAVWFRYEVQEEWERWETETTRDSKGNTHTRTVRKTGWQTVAEGGETPPFFIEDDTGAVLVRPERADVEPVPVFSKIVERGDALYFSKGPAHEIVSSNHRRRFVERAIPLHAPLFVAGRARERSDIVAPEIAADKEQDLFIISCRSEARVQSAYRLQFWILGVLSLLPLPAAGWIVAANRDLAPDWRVLAGAAGGVAAAWALSWLWMTFNSLVHLRNRVAQAWSLIDVQLERRADLIPRLLETVSGLRDHERRVQNEVSALRAQATATVPGRPGPDVASARAALVAVVERYPELQANDAFLRLQRELSDTETRIALARDYFNEIATYQNTRLEIIPDRWIAPLAGLKARPLLGIESFERAPVSVKLDEPADGAAVPAT